jgi:hypothetical protein
MGRWCSRLDAAEEAAFRHLCATCTSSIVYEPDGNIPPDFLVDGRVAVEVRRLNRNEVGSCRPVGLEQSRIPFVHRFQNLLASAGGSGHAAWWVGLEFRRPIPPWEMLAPALGQLLEGFVADTSPRSMRQAIGPNVTVEIVPRPSPAQRAFALGWVTDGDADECGSAEAERNLRLCIGEKTSKVARYRSRYPEWWLLLVDVAFGLDQQVGTRIRDLPIGPGWDRIIILDPAVPGSTIELRRP